MEQNEIERDFKGIWIPKEIWLDNRLNALDKVIFAEIDSLDSEETGCYASNEYLAEFCQCSETKVSNAISKLIQLGYLSVKSFDGRQRILKSRFTKNVRQPYKICKADSQNLQGYKNNIDNNIEDNNKERKKERTSTYDDILNDFVSDADLKDVFYEFIKMRKLIKKPLTDYALKRIINKLSKMGDVKTQIAILQKSIENCWQDVFPLTDKNRAEQPAQDFQQHSFSKQELNSLFDNLDA